MSWRAHRDSSVTDALRLVQPAERYLSSYVQALKRGWSPDNVRPEAAIEQMALIESDPSTFLALQSDRDAHGPAIELPDGSVAERLPGFHMWMWDGEFCGSISMRWKRGTTALPPTCLGHIGYGVVAWKRGMGYATRALALMLPLARDVGLPFVDITTNVDNVPSRRVIEKNGGALVERFYKLPAYGGTAALRYRVSLV